MMLPHSTQRTLPAWCSLCLLTERGIIAVITYACHVQGSLWKKAFGHNRLRRGNAVPYVLRRNRGLSLTDTILTRSRTDKRPTTLFSSVTARWRIRASAMSLLASRTVRLMSI